MKILFTLESSAGMEVKMKQIKGGVTAAKDLRQQVQQQESNIKTEQIWQ